MVEASALECCAFAGHDHRDLCLFAGSPGKRSSWFIPDGVAVWLIARPVFHVGASGVVYGLVSSFFWSGVFRREVHRPFPDRDRGLYANVCRYPAQSGRDRGESHLLGGAVGILVAWWFKAELEPEEHRKNMNLITGPVSLTRIPLPKHVLNGNGNNSSGRSGTG